MAYISPERPMSKAFGPLGRHTLLVAAVALAGCERAAEDPRAAPPATAATASVPSPALSPVDPSERIVWPVPTGWNHESIPFPLGFAPQLPYRGVEELRFAPGWSNPGQPGYWSYDIVWWLTDRPTFDAVTIGASLTAYFLGLSESVGAKKYRIDPKMFRSELVADGGSRLTGRISSMDAFTTGLPVTLNAVIEIRECAKARRHAVTLMLSPRPRTDPIWRDLEATAMALVCG